MTPTRPLREAVVVYAIALALCVTLFQLARVVPLVARHLLALVGIVFLYLPVAVATRRGEELAAYGFTIRPVKRSLAFALLVPAIVFPLFLAAFVLFYQGICAPEAPAAAAALAPPGWCARFDGWGALARPRLPPDVFALAFTQLVVIALPEELFFRGWLLARLEQAWPSRRVLLGGGLGLALVASSALFAVAHVVADGDPRRLAVFFPGLLFGWMRSATGSIAAPVVAHASSNLYIEVLQRTFFG